MSTTTLSLPTAASVSAPGRVVQSAASGRILVAERAGTLRAFRVERLMMDESADGSADDSVTRNIYDSRLGT
ncbi:MAG: hypothetical protein ABJB74_22340 [Gemmatimonas sp.]